MLRLVILMYSRAYRLGICGRNLRRRLVSLTEDLSTTYALADVAFDDMSSLSIGCGRTTCDVSEDGRRSFLCLIGSKDMPAFLQRVDDVTVLDAFVSVYHEFEHVRQSVEYESDADVSDESLMLCVDDAASCGNSLHYCQNRNRYRFELQAEHGALKHLQHDLPLLFPNRSVSDLESCLLWYVNQKAQFDKLHPLYCGQPSAYDSMAAVYDSFDDLYDSCDSGFPLYADNEMINGDVFSQVLYLGQDAPVEWEYFQEYVLQNTDGFMRKVQMACVSYYLMPELANEIPGLSQLNLQPKNIFGKDFPESRYEILLRLKPRDSFDVHRDAVPCNRFNSYSCADMPKIDYPSGYFDTAVEF